MTTPTTDRDDLYRPLYRQAIAVYLEERDKHYGHPTPGQPKPRHLNDGIRAVVDLVLDAHPAERQPWEVLREAAQIYERRWPARATGGDLRIEANRLESEHRAAQENAEREAERKKLIEQAAWIVAATRDHGPDRIVSIQDRQIAEGLAAAGLLSAPTTDGGEASVLACGSCGVTAAVIASTGHDVDRPQRTTTDGGAK